MNSSVEMRPQYTTVLFTQIWDSAEDFKSDFQDSPFDGCIKDGTGTGDPDNVSLLYYLLYAKYGNNPIANNDITQFKFKLYSVIFQYGPTWEKKLDIQSKLRALSEADIMAGAKAIYNSAMNPSTAPSTGSLDELTYINSQNTTNYKKSKLEAYNILWSLLDDTLTAKFIEKFGICFKKFVYPEEPLLFVTEDDEEEEE